MRLGRWLRRLSLNFKVMTTTQNNDKYRAAAEALDALDATREHPRTDLGARMKRERAAAAHTPTPWTQNGIFIGPLGENGRISPVVSLADGRGGFFGNPERRLEDGALIVRAVNSHAESVAALIKAEAALACLRASYECTGDSYDGYASRALPEVRAAIARATSQV